VTDDPFPDRSVPLLQRTLSRTVTRQEQRASEELAQFIDATCRLMRRSRGADPQIREILREAGLSTQAFYRHFHSKDELVLVLLDEAARWVAKRVDGAIGSTPAGPARARAWITATVELCLRPGVVHYSRALLPAFSRLAYEQPDHCDELLAIVAEPLQPAGADGDGTRVPPAVVWALADLALGCIRRRLAEGTTASLDGELRDTLTRLSAVLDDSGAPAIASPLA
jgi:AcrR family transcriptional regulator